MFRGTNAENQQVYAGKNGGNLRMAKAQASGVAAIDYDVEELIGYRNSAVQITPEQIFQNIVIQRDHYLIENHKLDLIKGSDIGYNFTVEMETGTRKTYTYIRTMYELNKKYGWSKFIIIVPSIAIREGFLRLLDLCRIIFRKFTATKSAPLFTTLPDRRILKLSLQMGVLA